MTNAWKYTHDDSTPSVFVPGNRDAWADVVYNINKYDTPFFQRIKKKKIGSVKWTWMTEELNDPSAKSGDAKAQGSTPSATETPRYECFNYTNIFTRRADVTGTAEEQKHIGVPDEMERQMLNHAKELKRSVQLRGLAGVRHRAPTAGSTASIAMGFPGLCGFFGDITLHVDGTRRYGSANTANVCILEENFEEDGTSYHGFRDFKVNQQLIWALGSQASECYCGITDKAYVSKWDTSGVNRYTTKIDEVKEMVDVIITDCGTTQFIPVRNYGTKYPDTGSYTFDGSSGTMLTDFALLLDPAYAAICMFRNFKRDPLAKVGDLTSEQLVVEFTFESSAPYGMCVFNFSGASAHGTPHALYQTAASYSTF